MYDKIFPLEHVNNMIIWIDKMTPIANLTAVETLTQHLQSCSMTILLKIIREEFNTMASRSYDFNICILERKLYVKDSILLLLKNNEQKSTEILNIYFRPHL